MLLRTQQEGNLVLSDSVGDDCFFPPEINVTMFAQIHVDTRTDIYTVPVTETTAFRNFLWSCNTQSWSCLTHSW